ncbi:MAG TPA: hypothetical protein VMR21_03650 [Vicinamibacteria bacterium]|nr:hypothetical protein [Vicinamibacteria bacterium]
MRLRGCLIAAGVLLALCGAVAAVFGPGVLRRARGAYAPIARMQGEQADFEAWVKQQGWREPALPSLTAEKLDAFLALRKELLRLEGQEDRMRNRSPESQKPSLRDVPAIVRGVGDLVGGRLAAFRRHGLTPAEYDYLERLVYGEWRSALVSAGTDPAARNRAAAEIEKAARKEPPPVRARLRQIAAEMRARVPPAPAGIPADGQQVLLARAAAIEAQPPTRVPARVPRPRRRPSGVRPTASPP